MDRYDSRQGSANINRGKVFEEDLESLYPDGKFIYPNAGKDARSPDSKYLHCEYLHPETGERLQISRLYCSSGDYDKCHYVELKGGKDGESAYHYADESACIGFGAPGKDIDAQLKEDNEMARALMQEKALGQESGKAIIGKSMDFALSAAHEDKMKLGGHGR